MDGQNIHVSRDRFSKDLMLDKCVKKCFNCHKTGHYSRQCPDIKCWECHKKGHTKKVCFVRFFRVMNFWNKKIVQWNSLFFKNLNKRNKENENNIFINSMNNPSSNLNQNDIKHNNEIMIKDTDKVNNKNNELKNNKKINKINNKNNELKINKKKK